VRKLWLIVLVFPFLGCTSTEDMNLLHREITDVQRQVQTLETATLGREDLRAMERKMEDLTSQTMRSNADLAMRVSQLQEQIEALHASLDLTTRRLQTISQEMAAARSRFGQPQLPPVTTVPAGEGETGTESETGAATPAETAPPLTSTATPEELYRSSYEDYLRGNYDLASQGFSEYIKRWPNTDLSDNAVYWIGECYDAQDLSQEALDVFAKILEDYPTSDKAAAAQLKKGLLYLKLGDQGQGVVHLQYVVYEHPGTKEADLARDRLRSLGLTIR